MKELARASILCAAVVACTLGTAAVWPLPAADREELFEIPNGTFKRRMAGDPVEILPSEIRLTLGAKDVLLLRNRDDVPQIFGPTLIMPGQSLRLPFDQASEYQFACSAHRSGQLTVVVEGGFRTLWSRLRVRASGLSRAALGLPKMESAG